jgi:HEAT repeat protein
MALHHLLACLGPLEVRGVEAAARAAWLHATGYRLLQGEALGRFAELSPAVLALLTCHPSGHVRASALGRLGQRGALRVAWPFLLLRLNDWVPQVREAAAGELARALDEVPPPVLVQHLPLLDWLEGAQRLDAGPLVARVEERLSRADTLGLLEARLADPAGSWTAGRSTAPSAAEAGAAEAGAAAGADLPAEAGGTAEGGRAGRGGAEAAARLRAWRLLWAARPSAHTRLLLRALEDGHAPVRRWAAARAAELPEGEGLQRVLLRMGHSPLAVVRREACVLAASQGRAALAGAGAQVLRAALFDPSRLVRAHAQRHLARESDVAGLYRQAVQEEHALAEALAGLGETGGAGAGGAGDAALVALFLAHARPQVRARAAQALARLDPSGAASLLPGLVGDLSPRVSRAAAAALRRAGAPVAPERLRRLLAQPAAPHVARHARRLAEGLAEGLARQEPGLARELAALARAHGGS